MLDLPVEVIGGFAGLLCTVSFLPQVIKIFRSKNTRDISLLTFSVLAIGVLIWFIYGLMIKDIPVIMTNISIFILTISIVFMKLKYK
ncbi:SemiSWEET family sugar transporter [Elusimicrobiota bacterium]